MGDRHNYARLIDCIYPSVGKDVEIYPNSNILDDLELDSLSLVEILERIEKEFKCRQINDFELMNNVDTVGDLYAYLDKHYFKDEK